MKKIGTTLLLGLFIAFNLYWIKNHLHLDVLRQIMIVMGSVFVYFLAAMLEIFHPQKPSQRRKKVRMFAWGMLIYYFFFIGTVVFFDGYFFSRSGSSEVNTKIFYTVDAYFKLMEQGDVRRALGNLIGNLILFAPMGILLPLIHPWFRKGTNFILSVIFISITVEVLQYQLLIGRADIDDVILNVTGALFSFYIARLMFYLCKDRIEEYFKKDE